MRPRIEPNVTMPQLRACRTNRSTKANGLRSHHAQQARVIDILKRPCLIESRRVNQSCDRPEPAGGPGYRAG